MSSLRILVLAALAILIAAGGTSARADGKFIPSYTLRPVEIPTQAAAISFSEGKQVLTIWNTIQTTAGETAWVLPLPAKPDAIQKTAPEAFRLLEMLCAPEVKAQGDGLSRGKMWALGIFCVGWGLLFLRLRRASEDMLDELRFVRWMGLGLCMIVSLIALLGGFDGMGMPKFWAASTGEAVAGVHQLDAQSVGAYETTVLSATGSGPLNEWLKTGGFPEFTGAELAVVDDYSAKGWVFLCARMKLDQGKPVHAPHPLTVRFATGKVIYPMRLTAGSGPAVEVRLFVIGGEALRDPTGRLATYVDAQLPEQIKKRTGRPHLWTSADDSDYESFRNTEPNEYDRKKGIPPDLLFDALWQAQRINHNGRLALLKGIFRPESDWSDIQLQPTNEGPRQPKVATRGALTDDRLSFATLVAAPLFFVLTILVRLRTPTNGSRPGRRSVRTVIWVSAGLFIALWLVPWNTIGVEIVGSERLQRSYGTDHHAKQTLDAWIHDISSR